MPIFKRKIAEELIEKQEENNEEIDIGYDIERLGTIYNSRMFNVESFSVSAATSNNWVKTIEGDYYILIRTRLRTPVAETNPDYDLRLTLNSSNTDTTRMIVMSGNDFIVIPAICERIFFEATASSNPNPYFVTILSFNDYAVFS